MPYQPDLVILGLFEDDVIASKKPDENSSAWEGINPFKQKSTSVVLQKFYLLNFIRNVFSLYEYKYRYRFGHNYLRNIEERKKVWGPDNPTNIHYKAMTGNSKNF